MHMTPCTRPGMGVRRPCCWSRPRCGTFVAHCLAAGTPNGQKGRVMTEHGMQVYIDAGNRHSAEDVISFMTPDVVYVDTALGEQHQGHDAVRHFVEQAEATLSS